MCSCIRSEEEAEQLLATLEQGKVTAVVRTKDAATARKAADAAIRGGFDSVEFTLTIPGALDLIAEYSKRPGIVVGAGSVFNIEQAKQVVNAGCDFVVTPVLVVPVIEWCRMRNIVIMSGCYSPSEMYTAYAAGAHIAKLFPGPANGPAFIKAVRGPMPYLRVVQTTGATEENCHEYMQAGCFGIGFTAVLFNADDIANERWDRIEDRARRMATKTRGAALSKL